jgi:hypothetical protein
MLREPPPPRKPAPPMDTYLFQVGSGRRVVRIEARSRYDAKTKLLIVEGLAEGTRYKLLGVKPGKPA